MDKTAQTQTWNPERYARTAAYVSELGAAVLELLGPRPGERILDLGCGDGALTEKLIEAGASVLGVDASAAMVAAAKARGIEARVMNGHALVIEREFDAVFSNAALHWMRAPDAVIAGVRRALKAGGRFVAEMGGFACVAAISVAIEAVLAKRGIRWAQVNPWYFPSPDDYGARLRAHGFAIDYIALVPRPTPLPAGIEAFLDNFAENFFRAMTPEDRAGCRAEVVDLLRPILCDEQGRWTADYTRLRFAAHLSS